MPIYEYRCESCGTQFEELLATSTSPTPPCPQCASDKIERLMSRISTEWMPSDVNWHRVNSSWD
jgi:putative FmdB family regulatory protein